MGASPACLDSLPPCEPVFTALFPSLRKNPAERMSYLELMKYPFFTLHKTKKTDIAAFVKEILGEDS